MSLVSIIIPVYNTSSYLKKCVDSVLGQTYQSIEIILVDDGSTDDSYRLCKEIEAEYNSVYVIHKENGGLSSARLAGFEVCHGDYVQFVDSDDYIEPTMIEKLVTAIMNNQAELAICGYIEINAGVKTNHLLPFKNNVMEGKDDIVNNYIQPLTGISENGINIPGFLCIRLHKRSLIQKHFFGSENKYFAEDHVFDLLYSDYVERIAIVNEPLYNYVIHNASLTNKYRRRKTEMLNNLYLFYLDFLAERNISYDEERRFNFLNSLVYSSIDNAVLSGSYNNFLDELNVLKESKYIDYLANKKAININRGGRLACWLLNHGMYRSLYCYRKWRIERARNQRRE